MSEVQYEQNLHDLALIRTDPAWALTAVQEWRRLKAENERLREALRVISEGYWATNGFERGVTGARKCARSALGVRAVKP